MSSRNGCRSASPCSGREPRTLGVAALVQLPDQRAAGLAPGLRREELPRGGAGPDDRPEQLRPRARVHERPRVARRDLGDHVLGDPEEPGDPVEGGARVVDEVPVAQHQHLLAREVLEEVGDLAAVHPETAVVPERRPALVDAPRLAGAGLHDVGARLEPVGPQVHPVGVGPVDRVAQHRDQLGPRQVASRSGAGRRGGRGRTACSRPPAAGRPHRRTGRGSAAAARSTRGCCARRRDPCTPAGASRRRGSTSAPSPG